MQLAVVVGIGRKIAFAKGKKGKLSLGEQYDICTSSPNNAGQEERLNVRDVIEKCGTMKVEMVMNKLQDKRRKCTAFEM